MSHKSTHMGLSENTESGHQYPICRDHGTCIHTRSSILVKTILETLQTLAPAITVPTQPEQSDTAITNCKSLFDLVSRTATPACSKFRVQLMARAIKELLQEETHLRWVPSGAQLADNLTKAMDSHFMRETLKYGYEQTPRTAFNG